MEPMKPMKPMEPMKPMKPMDPPDASWYPEGLSQPSSAGEQNGMRYAFFAPQRRLAIEEGGRVTLYDTGDARIQGVSQSSGSSASFSTADGEVALDSLKKVG